VIYTEWIFFGALALGMLSLRRQPGYHPAFRAPGFPVSPLLFAIACLAIVVNQVVSDPRNSAFGLGLVLAGVPVYFIWSSKHANRRLS
jgi:APA family basic amino acid/polyamine antiporter